MPRPQPLSQPVVPDRQPSADAASVFRHAVAAIEAGIASNQAERPEVVFESEPPPRRLAPHAAAIAATVEIGGREIAWGRFVLLYDPAGQDGWEGPFRVIAYLRAELEPEIAADPLIGEVGWTWLTEALEARSAAYLAPSGTVTRVVTEGFGAKQNEPVATEFEMRASWSPTGPGGAGTELTAHVSAWVDALCTAAGMPPVAPGVARLRPPADRRRL